MGHVTGCGRKRQTTLIKLLMVLYVRREGFGHARSCKILLVLVNLLVQTENKRI